MLSLISVAALVFLSRLIDPPVIFYVSILMLGTGGTFALLWKRPPLTAGTVLAVAAMLHIVALFGVAAFEDDYFRFIWDGYKTITNGTTYGIAPAQYFADTSIGAPLQAVLDSVNNPELPTIYGPVLQITFAVAYALGGADPLALRILFAVINLALVALLIKSTGPHNAALYAWSPLAVTEVIVHIHPDAIMAAFLLAGLMTAKRYPLATAVFFGMATGTKIVALAAWPLLARLGWRPIVTAIGTVGIFYLPFALQGQGIGFDSTETFAAQWYFNPIGFAGLASILSPTIARTIAAIVGIMIIMIIHARTRSINALSVAAIFGVVLLVAPAVNSWYILWFLPFAVGSRSIWPFAAATAIPLSYLTGLNLDDYNLEAFAVHPAAWSAELFIITAALIYDWRQYRKRTETANPIEIAPTPITEPEIAVVIPALNEAQSIGSVIAGISHAKWSAGSPKIIVVDNGSTDGTGQLAEAWGATTVREEQRGYGAACLAGIAALPPETNIVLFMDADGSDVPQEAIALVGPIIAGQCDLVIGSRALGNVEAGAMTVPQCFGNWLATRLVKWIWDKKMTDLGPFRAIRRDALIALDMKDRDFGWTIEMQVKAVQQKMRIAERPADYRKRIGISKISGTINGVFRAGTKILYVIGREAFCR